MRNTITSILLLITSVLYSQNKKLLNILPLTKTDKIGFAFYDKEFKMYREPIIISNGNKYKVKGCDSENYSDGGILSMSPNKKFFVLDYIIKGYVEDGISKRLHENYLCVIIDIHKKEVALQMQDGCSGDWIRKNQWINDQKIIFDGK